MFDGDDGLEERVLSALVEGFRAREGMKQRFQALSEYEVARRLGIGELSHAGYEQSEERAVVRAAFARLERRGLIRVQSLSGRYDTFVPVTTEPARPPDGRGAGSVPELEQPSVRHAGVSTRLERPTTIDARLDEMIRLLTSIDRRLGLLESAMVPPGTADD